MRARMMGVVLVMAALFAPCVAKGSDLAEALSAYERGDFARAFPTFQRYASAGIADAQSLVGSMYTEGKGVPKNDREAVRWYRLAADQGHQEGQYNLGNMYKEGKGVLQDYGEAARLYRLAAEQGYAEAQCGLGTMYDEGKGVPQSYREAVIWYRKAAARGSAVGMANLGAMYAEGQGVPQDHVLGHMWSNLAAAAGGSEFGASNRDIAARRMTPAQIAEAQRLARECLASNYERCGEPVEIHRAR